ncbi:MAG: LysM peptidoglycan-binding domain-containing protein [Methylococcaceae bacterium]|nr:LysM peptidoglycan-binding domain-containing protein [Methylococcaceae bacterium]
MRNNSNRSVKIFCLSIILIVTGCSEAPKEPLVINGPPVVSRPYYGSVKEQPRFHFKKRLKNLFSHHDTVWERMFSLYSFPEVNNARVDEQLNYYLDHPDYIARIQERAAPYLHLILDEIESKNLPGELALLPVVESAFIPEAYSRSAASGLWQFIPSTGRLYGLEQNAWYDGRRDVYASTVAATTFLKELSEEFNGDYFLALASYNWGKGNVSKALTRNEYQGLPTDYWSLNLPKETEDYVPRLLAVAKLFANAEQYGIRLQPIPNRPYCEVVNVGAQLDIDKAAELAQTPLSHFLKLNPCFKKGSTSPYGPHRLLIPSHRVQSFKENLAHLPYEERVDQRQRDEEALAEKVRQNELAAQRMRDEEEERLANKRKHEVIAAKERYFAPVSTSLHKVNRGETLSEIARSSGTTVDNLRQLNKLSKSSVNSGTFIKVPASNRASVIKEIAKPSKAKSSGGQVYIVKKGDTFYNVSKRFAMSQSSLAAMNNISPNSNLKSGQKLFIKGSGQLVASASSSRLIHYTVKKGDSLMQLSRKFGVSLTDLRKSNPQTGKGLIPGQSIKIVVDNTPST